MDIVLIEGWFGFIKFVLLLTIRIYNHVKTLKDDPEFNLI